MCLILVAWKTSKEHPLVVAANRDEFHARPASPAAFWDDRPGILAGRDLEARGTWMGVSRAGRFAAVTNFRDPSERRTTARSRGELVSGFLASDEPPEAFLARLAPRAADYNGFNLIAGDGRSLWCFSTREGRPREVAPGIHGLSNHVLDEPWPKVVRARAAMEQALRDADPFAAMEAAMASTEPADDDALPETGVGLEWERRLAPALITGADYGTRSTTLLRVGRDGSWHLREHTRGANGAVTSTVDHGHTTAMKEPR